MRLVICYFFGSVLGAACALAYTAEAAAQASSAPSIEADDTFVYVGTYTGGASKGIYLYRLVNDDDAAIGAMLEPLGVAAEARNPSFLEIDPKRRLLFAVSEAADAHGQPGGAVSSYAIDDQGRLKLINQQSTRGGGPCHLALDKTGRYILAANYGGGSVVVLPVADDGRLGAATDFVQHEGRSVNPQRQAGPHAHFVTTDPANRFALVCDLGLDKVLVYRFDASEGKLTPNDPPAANLKPGAGPRHLAFHPSGKLVYVINELDSTVTVFNFNAQSGELTEFQTVSTLPADFTGENTTAEIAVHPNGKLLYASNRGHDSIAIFTIDRSTGKIELVGVQPTGGQTPRHFEVDPEGRRLIIANQNSDTLVLCKIDLSTGLLTSSSDVVECTSPVCVKFLKAARP